MKRRNEQWHVWYHIKHLDARWRTSIITIKPSDQPIAVKAVNVNATADGGKVTLSGRLRSRDEQTGSEISIWDAPGFTEVEDNLAALC